MEIKKGIYWVGAVDWDLRSFHGYLTQEGSTYNAYLVVDEKIVLVDTVKEHFSEELINNIKKIIDPAKIDYVIANHVEMDHSGALGKIMEYAKNAKVVCSPNGEKGLKKHFNCDWNFEIVKTNDTISIGSKTLKFVLATMVHWPDSMATYCVEDKVLFSNDAFGQHIASSERFDDELEWDYIKKEAAKYYANIVMPYSSQVQTLLSNASGLPIDVICPSHGIIYRKKISEIINLYKNWSANIVQEKAVVVYDTMWGSTKKMADAIKDVLGEKNIPYKVRDLKLNHISDIMPDILSAKYLFIGSSTLNNGMLPTVAAFLEYFKGLAPVGRTAVVFGSYGWGGQAVENIEKILDSAKINVPLRGLKIQYIPSEEQLNEFKNKIGSIFSKVSK